MFLFFSKTWAPPIFTWLGYLWSSPPLRGSMLRRRKAMGRRRRRRTRTTKSYLHPPPPHRHPVPRHLPYGKMRLLKPPQTTGGHATSLFSGVPAPQHQLMSYDGRVNARYRGESPLREDNCNNLFNLRRKLFPFSIEFLSCQADLFLWPNVASCSKVFLCVGKIILYISRLIALIHVSVKSDLSLQCIVKIWSIIW